MTRFPFKLYHQGFAQILIIRCELLYIPALYSVSSVLCGWIQGRSKQSLQLSWPMKKGESH